MRIWVIRFGATTKYYFTAHHAQQFMDALMCAGREFVLTQEEMGCGSSSWKEGEAWTPKTARQQRGGTYGT